jgi:hypothetical protein
MAVTHSEFSVRVTAFTSASDQWKLVHRHADPITTARSGESAASRAWNVQ